MQLTLDGVDKQDALAVLRNKSLERIDGGIIEFIEIQKVKNTIQ